MATTYGNCKSQETFNLSSQRLYPIIYFKLSFYRFLLFFSFFSLYCGEFQTYSRQKSIMNPMHRSPRFNIYQYFPNPVSSIPPLTSQTSDIFIPEYFSQSYIFTSYLNQESEVHVFVTDKSHDFQSIGFLPISCFFLFCEIRSFVL